MALLEFGWCDVDWACSTNGEEEATLGNGFRQALRIDPGIKFLGLVQYFTWNICIHT
jgi:hypothetical protein